MINFAKLKELVAVNETVTITAVLDDKGKFTISVSSKAMADKKITPVIVTGTEEELQSYFNSAFGTTAMKIKTFSTNAGSVEAQITKAGKAKPGAKETPKPAQATLQMNENDGSDDGSDDDNDNAGDDNDLPFDDSAKASDTETKGKNTKAETKEPVKSEPPVAAAVSDDDETEKPKDNGKNVSAQAAPESKESDTFKEELW